jgi:hypothetical protein
VVLVDTGSSGSLGPIISGLYSLDIGGVLVKTVRSLLEAHQRAGLPFHPPSGPEFEARRATLPRRGIRTIGSERYLLLFSDASQAVYTAADVRRISEASSTSNTLV